MYAIPPFVLQTLIWIPTRLALRFFCKLEIVGFKKIQHLKAGAIFVANHTSELDPILIPAALPFLSPLMPMFYASREKSFYKDNRFGWKQYIYGGNFFKIWGAYEVIVGKNNYELALKNHIKIAGDGHSVCIFPEGRKNLTCKEIEAKGGAVYLAHKTGKPIIPVAISGAIEKKKIVVEFGKPLYSKDIFDDVNNIIINERVDDYKKVASSIMNRIKKSVKN